MTSNHYWALALSGIAAILGFLQTIVPVLPSPWQGLVIGVLGVAAFYHVIKSGSPSSLAAAGYFKK